MERSLVSMRSVWRGLSLAHERQSGIASIKLGAVQLHIMGDMTLSWPACKEMPASNLCELKHCFLHAVCI